MNQIKILFMVVRKKDIQTIKDGIKLKMECLYNEKKRAKILITVVPTS